MFFLRNEDPFRLVKTIQVAFRLFGEFGKMCQMAVEDFSQLTSLGELFLPKLTHGFK
jgi:hypothetical protein